MKPVLCALLILSLASAFGLGWLLRPEGASSRSVETLAAGLRERDAVRRAQLLSDYFGGLQPAELPSTLELVERNYLGVQTEDVALLMHAWTRFDAPGALDWARGWPTQWRDRLMHEAMFAWGFWDGPGALQAIEALDDDLQRQLTRSALEGWLHSEDRDRAGTYIAEEVHDPRVRRRLTFTLAGEAAQDGPDAVIRWVEAIPDDAPGGFKQNSFYHACGVISRDDPRRAAELFESHRAAFYSEGSIDVIARKWARHHDPMELFAWLRGLEPAQGKRADEVSGALAAGFRAWHQEDAAAAERWLDASLPDPFLDPAVEDFAWSQMAGAPASAAAWALRIQDDELRERSLKRILGSWLRRDGAAASAWLAQSELPDSLKRSIRTKAAAAVGNQQAALERKAREPALETRTQPLTETR